MAIQGICKQSRLRSVPARPLSIVIPTSNEQVVKGTSLQLVLRAVSAISERVGSSQG
jgi:hypothetical protein